MGGCDGLCCSLSTPPPRPPGTSGFLSLAQVVGSNLGRTASSSGWVGGSVGEHLSLYPLLIGIRARTCLSVGRRLASRSVALDRAPTAVRRHQLVLLLLLLPLLLLASVRRRVPRHAARREGL